MFGIGGFEFIIIIVFALIIFGPDKLPEVGKQLVKVLRKFNEYKTQIESTVKTDILRPEDMQTMREIQGDFNSLTSTLKNPMSLLNTKPGETAQRTKQEVSAATRIEPSKLKAQKEAENATVQEAEEAPIAEADFDAEPEVVAETVAEPAADTVAVPDAEPAEEPAAEAVSESEPVDEPQPAPVQTQAQDIWAMTSSPEPAREGEDA